MTKKKKKKKKRLHCVVIFAAANSYVLRIGFRCVWEGMLLLEDSAGTFALKMHLETAFLYTR